MSLIKRHLYVEKLRFFDKKITNFCTFLRNLLLEEEKKVFGLTMYVCML